MKQLFYLFLIIITWGCSLQKKQEFPKQFQKLKNLTVYPVNAEPEETISFKKDAVYGSTKKIEIGQIGDVAVDSSGRVYCADIQESTIDVFEPDGRFITQLGRHGRGPGEFSYIKSLQIHNNLLYAFDFNFGIRRVNIFNLDMLTKEGTILLGDNRGKFKPLEKAYPGIYKIYIKNNGTYLSEYIANSFNPSKEWQNVKMRGVLYLLDKTGKIASNKLFEFIEEIRTYKWGLAPIKPFWGNTNIVLSSDNTVYRAGPDHFLIRIYSPKGIYKRAFFYPHKKIPLTRASAIEAGVPDLFIKNMKSMNLSPTWPVLMDLKIDNQNRLWVATVVQNMKVYQWWVLTQKGKLLARFDWPRSKPIEVIKNGNIYTRETDTTTGMSKIVRYRIEMKPSKK